jgi:hypothetical protein
MPSFEYSNLKVELKETPEGDLIEQQLQISFEIDGEFYHHQFFHDFKRDEKHKPEFETPPNKISIEFHKGINKYLADREIQCDCML